MKALIHNSPFPVCILRSGDPARCHAHIDMAETFARNTPPIQTRAADIRDDYEMTDSLDWLDGGFKS